MDEGKDIQYVATFEVFPEVELSDMKGFAIERPVAEVKDEDVDRIIETLEAGERALRK